MVEKTYLRYVVGPQGGAVVSSAALAVDAAVIPARYPSPGSSAPLRRPYGREVRSGRAAVAPVAAMSSSVVFVPSLEAVRVFSVRSGALLHTLIPAEAKMPLEVTTLQVLPLEASDERASRSSGGAVGRGGDSDAQRYSAGWLLLVGYSNGYVAVFSCSGANNYGLPVCRFYALGHRVDTQVLALTVDATRATLCSGGQDTDITVWDLVSQEGSFRLRGHRGGVVALAMVSSAAAVGGGGRGSGVAGGSAAASPTTREGVLLLSGSADGLVKVWNVALRQCFHTVIVSDTNITAMVLDSRGTRLYCGLRENFVKVYNTEPLLWCSSPPAMGTKADEKTTGSCAMVADTTGQDVAMLDHGVVPRKYHKPLTSLSFSPDGAFIVGCTSRTIEVFHVRSADDVKRKIIRKRKRQRGPATAASQENGNSEQLQQQRSEADAPSSLHKALPNKKKPKTGANASKGGAGDATKEEEEDAVDLLTSGAEQATDSVAPAATAADEVVALRVFFLPQKIRSVRFVPHAGRETQLGDDGATMLHIAVTYNNNVMETFTTTLTTSDREGTAVLTLTDLKPRHTLEWQGHHSDIRELAFVDTDTALLSMSKEKVMMWSLTVKQDALERDHLDRHDFDDAKEANLVRVDFKGGMTNVGSVEVEEATSMAAISSLLCCVGQKDGAVKLLDVASSAALFCDPAAHVGGVQHVCRKPDRSGFVSLGADRRLILWAVALAEKTKRPPTRDDADEAEAGTSRATLVQEREVELTETPLCAAFSPDGRFFGVGLQNNNIQLFFADSMKPYLSLFGHKLPPTALSFSSDGTLAASVGMDKSLRFWGTDFGDCHRAIHAHDDYVTDVQFLEDTHYVFTVSMDGSVKQWDGDNWAMIQLFRQHQRGLWAVAVTANSTCVATAGTDRCIRCFLRSQDIVFPQEEEERMAQEAMDEEVAKRAALTKLDGTDANGAAVAEVGVAGQSTATTAEAAERLMEALDIVDVEQQRKQRGDDATPRHPMLLNLSEWEFLWSVIDSIRPSELRYTLLSLTSVHVDALLTALETMVAEKAVLNFETASKVMLALVMMPAESGSTQGLRAAAIRGEISEARGARRLVVLRRGISEGLDESVSRMDYAVAGLQLVRQSLEEGQKMKFFDRSKVQGYKRRYHSRALPTSTEDTLSGSGGGAGIPKGR